jgi:hypothetical protein
MAKLWEETRLKTAQNARREEQRLQGFILLGLMAWYLEGAEATELELPWEGYLCREITMGEAFLETAVQRVSLGPQEHHNFSGKDLT